MVRTRTLLLGLALGVAALVFLGAPASGGRTAAQRERALDRQLVAQVNALRAAHGLRPLRLSRPLSAAAARHSFDMAAYGYFAHASSDGTAFWRRIRRYYSTRGFGRWTVGENLAWESPGLRAGDAIRMWMASPPHRANLLNPAWREIGLSTVRSDQGRGIYAGMRVIIVTADFGARAAN